MRKSRGFREKLEGILYKNLDERVVAPSTRENIKQEFISLIKEELFPKEEVCICSEDGEGHCDCGAKYSNSCRAEILKRLGN